jgi:hypothetical protein
MVLSGGGFGQAEAAVMRATWTGSVASVGANPVGGRLGDVAPGQPFAFEFVYDTERGNGDGIYRVVGGTLASYIFDYPSPALSASVTIDGSRTKVDTEEYGRFEVGPYYSFGTLINHAVSTADLGFEAAIKLASGLDARLNSRLSLSRTTDGFDWSGYISSSWVDEGSIGLQVDSLDVAPVPLPASALLLAAALAASAAALAGRRQPAAA